jgi:putative Mg2+ transporter-C (MgtC) family protein
MEQLVSSFSWDWNQVIVDLIRLTIAFVLAFPISWQRLNDPGRNIGFRTFPIVAIASCGYILIARHLPGASAETEARVLQGLISGMGFIGGGAILKEGGNVRGLAIAASLWTAGAIGAAVAFEREEIALVLSLTNFLLLRFLTPVVFDSEDERLE